MDHQHAIFKDLETTKKYIKTIAERYGFSGDISIYHGEVLCHQALMGFSDVEQHVLFSDASTLLFNPSSHLILTLIILMLEKSKKLKLNDRLNCYIPEYKDAPNIKIIDLLYQRGQVIDIISHHIMNNVAHDPSYTSLSNVDKTRYYFKQITKKREFSEVLSIINQHELMGKVGSDVEFSISHSYLLEEVITRILGKPYLVCVDLMIFKPMGISYIHDIVSLSKHYTQTEGLYHFEVFLDDYPKPYVTMTFDNIRKLLLSIVNHKLIDKSMWKRMIKLKDGIGMSVFDAAGFLEMRIYAGGHHITHHYHVQTSLSIITLSNYQGDWVMENDRWYSFSNELLNHISMLLVYPHKPRFEKLNKKNQTLAFDIELTDDQYRYVPSVYRCLAYTYLVKEAKHYILSDHGIGVGMATLIINPKKNVYSIRFLMIDKKYQKRGYGKILLQKAVEVLKEKGAKTLEISVVSTNQAAYHTYLASGFETYTVTSDFITLRKTL